MFIYRQRFIGLANRILPCQQLIPATSGSADPELTVFFRVCKGSLERLKERLDNYYAARLLFPEILQNIFPLSPALLQCLNTTIIMPLPKRTEEDSVVVLGLFVDHDPEKFDFVATLRILFCAAVVLVKDNVCGSSRVIFVLDGNGLTAKHFLKISPKVLYSGVNIMTKGAPCRLQAVHCLNMPPAADWCISFIKSVLKVKLAQRIYMQRSYEELLNWLPKKILPTDFGGDEEPLDKLYEQYRAKLDSFIPDFAEQEKKLQELDLIRARTTTKEVSAGSFRKLDID